MLRPLPFFALLACTATLAGCIKQPTDQQPTDQQQRDPLLEFSIQLFETIKAGDTDALVAKHCATKKELLEHFAKTMAQDPGLETQRAEEVFLIFHSYHKDVTDAQIEGIYRRDIQLFLNSYEEELAGKPIGCSVRIIDNPLLNAMSLIIWAEMPDGKYRGLLIKSVIETPSGYRVDNWLGLRPIDFGIMGPGSSLRTCKAVLKSDTREGCKFPEGPIESVSGYEN